MAKPNPLGQRVKQFQAFIPQPDLTSEKTVVHVYFQARDAVFNISVPDHIAAVVVETVRNCMVYRQRDQLVSASNYSLAETTFKDLLTAYTTLLQQQGKVRVIRFSVRANSGGYPHFPDISFTGAPALHFQYEVLWRVGDRLFRQYHADSRLESAGDIPRSAPNGRREGSWVIPWTAEREAFFGQMEAGLKGLIERLALFVGDLEGNLDHAIASRDSALLLPPLAPEAARG